MIRPLAAQFVASVGVFKFNLLIKASVLVGFLGGLSAAIAPLRIAIVTSTHRATKTVIIMDMMTADHNMRPLRPTLSRRTMAGIVPMVKHILRTPARIALMLESRPFWLKLHY